MGMHTTTCASFGTILSIFMGQVLKTLRPVNMFFPAQMPLPHSYAMLPTFIMSSILNFSINGMLTNMQSLVHYFFLTWLDSSFGSRLLPFQQLSTGSQDYLHKHSGPWCISHAASKWNFRFWVMGGRRACISVGGGIWAEARCAKSDIHGGVRMAGQTGVQFCLVYWCDTEMFHRNALRSLQDDNFLLYNQSSFTPGSGLSHMASVATRQSHAAQCAAECWFRSQRDKVEDLKDQLGIEPTAHWTPEHHEYVEMLEYSRQCQFINAVEDLKHLILQCLFELSKANLASTGESSLCAI